MKTRFALSICMMACLGGLVALSGETTAANTGNVILDETAYWRAYLVCRPPYIDGELMKEKGEELLGKKHLERLQKRVLKGKKSAKLGDDGWLERVLYSFGRGDGRSASYYFGILAHVKTSPPPADWMKTDFDDSDWTRQREPYGMGRASVNWWGGATRPSIQYGCFRSSFPVSDPARVGELKLEIVYRGGARVFLNGTEIARGHLPEGELPPEDETPGDAYPQEAYVPPDGEYTINYGKPRKGQLFSAAELNGNWDDIATKDPKAKLRRYRGGMDINLSRKCWDVLQSNRNRTLTASIPAKLVRKGNNVLAVELRASRVHPVKLKATGGTFAHNKIISVRLMGGTKDVPGCKKRPSGVQVWVEDIHHRFYSREFHPPGMQTRTARVIGGKNGAYAIQAAIGSDRELKGLKVEVTDLSGANGAAIPASSASVLYGIPHPSSMLIELGEYKSEHGRFGMWGNEAISIVHRHARLQAGSANNRKAQEQELKAIQFFDHLAPRAPVAIPADSCHPFWVSLKIPKSAAPGRYQGKIRVSAEGLDPVDLPLIADVVDWRVPDPSEFTTFMAFEQSAYGVAKQYGVEVWSEKHFKLIERSLELMGRIGNDWVNIPVLAFTEYGNGKDSPIRISRKTDGTYAFDYTIMDRYLDLVIKHTGKPSVIDFVVNHPGAHGSGPIVPPLEVNIQDEASGKWELVKVGHEMPMNERRAFWKALAASLWQHMMSKGLENSMYWGLPWDGVADSGLVGLLKEFAPQVTWARLSHGYAPDKTYTAAGTLFGHTFNLKSRKGWKREQLHLLYPRNQGSVITCFGTASPFTWRLLIDRALVAGTRGICRMGGDYWKRMWLKGFKGRMWMPGLPTMFCLWPGPDGAETSARFEILREGLQEGELRVYLEQAEEKIQDEKLKAKITSTLARHSHDTMIMSPREPYVKLAEYSSGWRTRSRRLYELAAEVARSVALDLDKRILRVSIPARGKASAELKLRNWVNEERSWKLSTDQAWIMPATTEGSAVPGQNGLRIDFVAAELEPEKPVKGELKFTDVGSDRTEALAVEATVGKVFTLRASSNVVNVAPGGKAQRSYTLANLSGKPLEWSVKPSAAWLGAKPTAGKLPPGTQEEVVIEAAPPGQERSRQEAKLAFTEAGGATNEISVVAHVVPAYEAPEGRPKGEGVDLQTLPAKRVTSILYSNGRSYKGRLPRFWQPRANRKFTIGKEKAEFQKGFYGDAPFKVTYSIEGLKAAAFAVEVGAQSYASFPPHVFWAHSIRLQYEIEVDGALKAQSGLMSVVDAPRLLVVKGLDAAKTLTLKVRGANDAKVNRIASWANPVLYVTGKPSPMAPNGEKDKDK